MPGEIKMISKENAARFQQIFHRIKYCQDEEYRQKKLARSIKWKEDNPEKYVKYVKDYYQKNKKKIADSKRTTRNIQKDKTDLV